MKATAGETIDGPYGTATRIRLELEDGDSRSLGGTVDSWFLDCPDQSPAWQNYALIVVHLRPIAGEPDPEITIEGATHQVTLAALDPQRRPLAGEPSTWSYLHPINVCEQLALPADEAARHMLRCCAQAVVDGKLPAEPMLAGAVEPWRSTLRATAEHARGERQSDAMGPRRSPAV